MWLTAILFFIGFIVLIKGADILIDGSVALANKLGISPLLVGLTVVAFGTSLPELVVNLFAGSSDATDLAIGNAVGSNIANVFLILGVAAFIAPLTVRAVTVWREILIAVMASAILLILVSDHILDHTSFIGLDRVDGLVLISYFVIFLYYSFGSKAHINPSIEKEAKKAEENDESVASIFMKTSLGIAGLILGGRWIVSGAITFASSLGISQAVIGLTVVAIGTSLPELVASVVAVKKRHIDIAVGNVVGSNLFNIFWVLGIGAILNPLPVTSETYYDILVSLSASVLLFLAMFIGKPKHSIYRPSSFIFIGLYVAYLIFVVSRNIVI